MLVKNGINVKLNLLCAGEVHSAISVNGDVFSSCEPRKFFSEKMIAKS